MNDLTWKEFERVDMRVGTVLKVEVFEKAKNPAYIITVDFGEVLGIKKTSAQVTALYNPEDIVGKQVVGVVNFPKKQIATIQSEFLLLGAVDGKKVTILEPSLKVKNGLRIS